MLSFLPKNPQDVMEELRIKLKKNRQALGYTQKELAERSGVSFGSLKRFEGSGQISLESLLKLAFILDCLENFAKICEPKEVMPVSIEDLAND